MANRKPLTNDEGEVRELTKADFADMRPASEVLPEILGAELAAELLSKKSVGRPKAEVTKVYTGLRLDPEVRKAFESTGKGWQTRINAALKDWLKSHSPA